MKLSSLATISSLYLLAALASTAQAALIWGDFSAPGAGLSPAPVLLNNASAATNFSYTAAVAGYGFYTTNIATTGSFNGAGRYLNDDGYPGGVGGAPGYSNTATALSSNFTSFAAAQSLPTLAGNNGLIFDGGDNQSIAATFDFTTLNGGVLPAGSWLFFYDIDQNEIASLVGPAGWYNSIATMDLTAAVPTNQSNPLPGGPNYLTSPTSGPFPASSSLGTQLTGMTGTTLSFYGPQGTRANGSTGPTVGTDATGLFVQTAIPLTSLIYTDFDNDPNNNYVSGVGGVAVNIPEATLPALLTATALLALRRRRTPDA
jgi:hypothetical protein